MAAIIAHPDEDTPRLMYADWLQENGDQTRAEFIRFHIEWDRRPQYSPPDEDLKMRLIAAWEASSVSGASGIQFDPPAVCVEDRIRARYRLMDRSGGCYLGRTRNADRNYRTLHPEYAIL